MLWNGHLGALSLTFDDGLPCQIEHALPELDRAGLKGTFFLIKNSPYDTEFRRDVWKKAAADGHEIGSHSVNHLKAATLSEPAAEEECRESRKFLEKELGISVKSFAYPFTDVTKDLRSAVSRHYAQARGGRVAREDKFLRPGNGFDMLNVPCYHVGPHSIEAVPQWAQIAIERQSWVVLMFHGIGPDPSQWDNVTTEQFREMLEQLSEMQASGLWIDTFGAVAENLRKAQ